jgi:serine/threonine protein phosphatase PrpC
MADPYSISTPTTVSQCLTESVLVTTGLARGCRRMQEDNFTIACPLCPIKFPTTCAIGLFDGHGGFQTANKLAEEMGAKLTALDDPQDCVAVQGMLDAWDLECLAESKKIHRVTGSTLCMMVLDTVTQRLLVINLGDSRCVVYTPACSAATGASSSSATPSILWETTDHNVYDPHEVVRVKAAGGTFTDGYVQCTLAITRAMGDWMLKTEGGDPTKHMVTAQADMTFVQGFDPARHRILLCSDGLLGECASSAQLVEIVEQSRTRTGVNGDATAQSCTAEANAQRAVHQTIQTLFAEHGSQDNMCLILVEFPAPGSKFVVPPLRNDASAGGADSPRTPPLQ